MTLTRDPAPTNEPVTYSIKRDPVNDVRPWEPTDRERAIYELGFLMGYSARQPEIDQLDQLDHEADRLYVAAFDHRHCACWRGRKHNVTW